MSYAIEVRAVSEDLRPADSVLLSQTYTQKADFEKVDALMINQREVSWIESLFIPVRTDSFGNLCKDLFLPGVFNSALKTKEVFGRIIDCMEMFAFDIITLPFRLITVIPRALYNAYYAKESHPFYRYLVENNVSKEDLSGPSVYIYKTRLGIYCTEAGKQKKGWLQNKHLLRFIELPKQPEDY